MKERNDIIRFVAERFNIEPNEDGDWDINDYDWQAFRQEKGSQIKRKRELIKDFYR